MERLAARLQLGGGGVRRSSGGGGSTIGRSSGSGSSHRPSMFSVKESAHEREAAAAAAADAAAGAAAAAAAVAPPAVGGGLAGWAPGPFPAADSVGGSVRRATVGSQASVRRRSTISRASMDRPTSIATHPAHADAAFCRSTFNAARLAMAADYRASRDGEVSPSEASPGEIQPAPTPPGVDQARLPLDLARPLSSPPMEGGGSSGGYAAIARPQDTTHALSADQVLLQRPYGRPYGASATGGYATGTTAVQLPASAPVPVARSARRVLEPFVPPITDSGMPHSRLQYVSTNDSPPPSMGSLTGAGFTVGGFGGGGGSSFSSGANGGGFSPVAGSPAAGNGRWGGGVGNGGGGGRRSRGSVSRHSAGSFGGLRPGVMEHALAQRGGPSPPMMQPRPCTPDKVHTVVFRGFVLRVLRSGALVQPRPFTLDKMRTLGLSRVGTV